MRRRHVEPELGLADTHKQIVDLGRDIHRFECLEHPAFHRLLFQVWDRVPQVKDPGYFPLSFARRHNDRFTTTHSSLHSSSNPCPSAINEHKLKAPSPTHNPPFNPHFNRGLHPRHRHRPPHDALTLSEPSSTRPTTTKEHPWFRTAAIDASIDAWESP